MTQQHDAPVSITSARSSRSDDIKRRQTKYLVSMGVRTICFILAVILPSPERWALVCAAVLLPYFAVVVANATDDRGSSHPAEFVHDQHVQITSGSVPSDRNGRHPDDQGLG